MSWDANTYVKNLKRAPDGERVTRSEKHLLLYLSIYYNDEIGGAWPSHGILADDALYSTKQVARILERCERKGIIRSWTSAVTVTYKGQNRVRNFYTFPALPTAYNDDEPPEITVKYRGKSNRDILTVEPDSNRDISSAPIGTFSSSHNKEVNINKRDARARDSQVPKESYLSLEDQEETAEIHAACQRAKYRPASDPMVVLINYHFYKWLAALCFKARDQKARRILTDKQKKSIVEWIVEMQKVEADLELIPRFADYWRADWKSRGGTMPPTLAQVREFWTEATTGPDAAVTAASDATDRQALTEKIRSGKEWQQ